MNLLKNILIISIVLIALFILSGCGPQADMDEPPVIRYGEDICDECNMIIDDSRYAASYVTTAGDVRRFDDIGGMLFYDQTHHEDVHIYWVHDYDSKEWINADKAFFVVSPNLTTPMGWGLAAFSDETGAESFIAGNGGRLTTLAALFQDVETGVLDPEKLSDHGHEEAEMEPNHEMEMETDTEAMNQNNSDMQMEGEE